MRARERNFDRDPLYSLWNRGALFRYQEREREILRLLGRHGFSDLEDVKIVDVGCGAGGTLRDLLSYGARPVNLAGVDLLEDRIARARGLAPQLDFRVASAAQLPFEDGSFDLALAFSSVTDAAMRKDIATEIARVLSAVGAVLWYDFWINPVSPDLTPLKLGEVRRLFGREPVEARRVTLAPPIARAVAPRSWLGCELLTRIPLLRTHWLALVFT